MTGLKNTDSLRHARVITRPLILFAVVVIIAASWQAEAFDFKLPGTGQKSAPAGGEGEKLYNDARKAYGSADYARVIDLTSKAITADPKSAKSYALRGKAKKDMGDVDNAMADVNKAIQIDPKLGEAYSIRAQVNEIMGDMKKAEADYSAACKNDFKDACGK